MFEAVAGEGEGTLVGTRFPSGTGIAGWVLVTRQPLVIDDVTERPALRARRGREDRLRAAAADGVPLLHDDAGARRARGARPAAAAPVLAGGDGAAGAVREPGGDRAGAAPAGPAGRGGSGRERRGGERRRAPGIDRRRARGRAAGRRSEAAWLRSRKSSDATRAASAALGKSNSFRVSYSVRGARPGARPWASTSLFLGRPLDVAVVALDVALVGAGKLVALDVALCRLDVLDVPFVSLAIL